MTYIKLFLIDYLFTIFDDDIYICKRHTIAFHSIIDLHTNAKSFGIFTESRFEGSLARVNGVKIDADKTIIEEINCETRTMQFFIQHWWISVFIAI